MMLPQLQAASGGSWSADRQPRSRNRDRAGYLLKRIALAEDAVVTAARHLGRTGGGEVSRDL
jgi:hypothetical protein